MYNDSYWATHDDELQNISTLAQELAASPAFNSSIGWKIQKDWDAAVNSLQRQGISPNDPTYKYRLYAQFNKEAEQSTSVLLFAGGEGLAAIKEFISARNAILATKGSGNTGGKILWGSWTDYEKVTVTINGEVQTYAKVGDRLYSKHAVDRMQPSGNRYGSPITQAGGDYGRGVAPEYIEQVIKDVKPVLQENGNLSYTSGSLQVITNQQGAVVTIITQ